MAFADIRPLFLSFITWIKERRTDGYTTIEKNSIATKLWDSLSHDICEFTSTTMTTTAITAS